MKNRKKNPGRYGNKKSWPVNVFLIFIILYKLVKIMKKVERKTYKRIFSKLRTNILYFSQNLYFFQISL